MSPSGRPSFLASGKRCLTGSRSTCGPQRAIEVTAAATSSLVSPSLSTSLIVWREEGISLYWSPTTWRNRVYGVPLPRPSLATASFVMRVT